MASTTSKYQQRMFARRKTSDIQRLANQYQKQSTALTGEYETDYAAYQKNVAEQMAPFEASMKKYEEVDMPAYESAAASYQSKLDKYNAKLEDVKNNPTQPKEAFRIIGNTPGVGLMIQAPGAKDVKWITNALLNDYVTNRGYSIEGDVIYTQESRPVPKFNQQTPKAPTTPVAPKINPFDEKPYQAKREELQTTYQREVSERKSARLGAARRESNRPMLQGA